MRPPQLPNALVPTRERCSVLGGDIEVVPVVAVGDVYGAEAGFAEHSESELLTPHRPEPHTAFGQ